MKIPKIEYEIYYILFNYDLKKLNLNSYKGTKIEISTSGKINDNIENNPKSDYYNDICPKTNSESGKDIPLKDR